MHLAAMHTPSQIQLNQQGNLKHFLTIEGLSKEETGAVPSVRAPYDTDVYCQTCNKTVHVKKGEVIPFCCGRLMEILD